MSGNNEPLVAKRARKEKSREKAIASTSSTAIMDPILWKNLPKDLYEYTMARVPIIPFFRFRVVCKDMNSMLSSKSFSKLYAQVKQTKHTWVYSTIYSLSNDGVIYDLESNKWYHPSLPPLPTNLPVKPVASAGGLVCLVDNKEYVTIYVCNPITGSFKELPARSISYGAIAMTANEDHSGYQIVCVSPNGEYQIYDSTINYWDKVLMLPPNIKRPLDISIKSGAVSIDGTHYFARSNPNGIICYNVTSRVWKEISIPASRYLMSDHTLVECGGKIMLVGLLNFGPSNVQIWELQKLCMLWKFVCIMPVEWSWEFLTRPVELDFVCNKDALMISIRSRTMYRLVMYDISTQKWSRPSRKIPSYGRRRPWIVNGTAFHPSLIASV